MIPGILGKKIGMTQIFNENGDRVPVTVVEAGPCTVQDIKSVEKHGYYAVQVGYGTTKENRINKPQREYLKQNKLEFKKLVREIRCEEAPVVKIGDVITNEMFQKGDFVDVIGTSKGKGFQGGMKRHHWGGGKETHGSNSHRAPGSIGQSSFPSRVFKGMRMAGQMGNVQRTTQNLEVIDVNTEDNTVIIKGAIPGANGSYVVLRYSLKKETAPRIEKKEEKNAEENKEGSKE